MAPNSKINHVDLVWLAGLVFTKRNFVKLVKERGLEPVIQCCPRGDLTREEQAAFEAVLANKRLLLLIETWWRMYDLEREEGYIPKATKSRKGDPEEPWHPYDQT